VCLFFVSDGDNFVVFVNNFDWIEGFMVLDFLCDVGKYFWVNYMVKKEVIVVWLCFDEGILYIEFSY